VTYTILSARACISIVTLLFLLLLLYSSMYGRYVLWTRRPFCLVLGSRTSNWRLSDTDRPSTTTTTSILHIIIITYYYYILYTTYLYICIHITHLHTHDPTRPEALVGWRGRVDEERNAHSAQIRRIFTPSHRRRHIV